MNTKLIGIWIAAIFIGLSMVSFGCHPMEGEGPPSPDRKTSTEVSEIFFEAYLNGDRVLAASVADPAALDKLVWDGGAGNNPTMMLMEETIVYEGGAIHLIIHMDGHVGAHIHDLELIAD